MSSLRSAESYRFYSLTGVLRTCGVSLAVVPDKMHPPLFKEHPDCQAVIEALVACHSDKPVAKFWGACNDAKAELDWCFALEKTSRQKKNSGQAEKHGGGMSEWSNHLARQAKEKGSK